MTTFGYACQGRYVITIKTSKGEVRVEFIPEVMYGKVIGSKYYTNDPEVVAALKKHPCFGGLIYIIEEGKEEAATVEEVAPSNNPKDYLAKDKPVIEEETVTSAATASLWLQKEKGEVFESTKVAEMKIEAAKKWNIIFKNWK